MFTGIVEEVGTVRSIETRGEKARIVVDAKIVLEGTKSGDSICVEGVCQTVTDLFPGAFAMDTLAESLKKTSLGALKAGWPVNLERSVRPESLLGGHIVQGHVSAACPIRKSAAPAATSTSPSSCRRNSSATASRRGPSPSTASASPWPRSRETASSRTSSP